MRHRSIQFTQVPSPAPISQPNLTPVIDVMLVLLIMFIITVPVMTHKVTIDLPTNPGIIETPADPPTVFTLDIDTQGGLHWNGASIREDALPAHLAAVRRAPMGELHLSAQAQTRYEDFDRILAIVKKAGIEQLGLVGNAEFAATLDR